MNNDSHYRLWSNKLFSLLHCHHPSFLSGTTRRQRMDVTVSTLWRRRQPIASSVPLGIPSRFCLTARHITAILWHRQRPFSAAFWVASINTLASKLTQGCIIIIFIFWPHSSLKCNISRSFPSSSGPLLSPNEITHCAIHPHERFLPGVAAGIDSGVGPRQKPGLRWECQFGLSPVTFFSFFWETKI